MEINTENCVINKVIRKLDGHGLVIDESIITISGKSLKECYEYFQKVTNDWSNYVNDSRCISWSSLAWSMERRWII